MSFGLYEEYEMYIDTYISNPLFLQIKIKECAKCLRNSCSIKLDVCIVKQDHL